MYVYYIYIHIYIYTYIYIYIYIRGNFRKWGTPKSFILRRFAIINQAFWGSPICATPIGLYKISISISSPFHPATVWYLAVFPRVFHRWCWACWASAQKRVAHVARQGILLRHKAGLAGRSVRSFPITNLIINHSQAPVFDRLGWFEPFPKQGPGVFLLGWGPLMCLPRLPPYTSMARDVLVIATTQLSAHPALVAHPKKTENIWRGQNEDTLLPQNLTRWENEGKTAKATGNCTIINYCPIYFTHVSPSAAVFCYLVEASIEAKDQSTRFHQHLLPPLRHPSQGVAVVNGAWRRHSIRWQQLHAEYVICWGTSPWKSNDSSYPPGIVLIHIKSRCKIKFDFLGRIKMIEVLSCPGLSELVNRHHTRLTRSYP